MNFLSHLYLSGTDENTLVGNYLGDFVRGKPSATLPEGVQKGIVLHRQIDEFTDAHPLVKASYVMIKPQLGRYGKVAIDIFFDYFLANQWNLHSEMDIEAFERHNLRLLEANSQHFPARAVQFLEYLKNYNMLSGYRDKENLKFVFHGMSRRANHDNDLHASVGALTSNEAQLKSNFDEFFEDLKSYVGQHNPHFTP